MPGFNLSGSLLFSTGDCPNPAVPASCPLELGVVDGCGQSKRRPGKLKQNPGNCSLKIIMPAAILGKVISCVRREATPADLAAS